MVVQGSWLGGSGALYDSRSQTGRHVLLLCSQSVLNQQEIETDKISSHFLQPFASFSD